MSDVYRGMWPFVFIQVIGLILCMAFPQIVLWLPKIAGMLE
jgi:TRAP-type mannitol/chloroaromatic compound transport system permease large subunit